MKQELAQSFPHQDMARDGDIMPRIKRQKRTCTARDPTPPDPFVMRRFLGSCFLPSSDIFAEFRTLWRAANAETPRAAPSIAEM